MSQDGMSEVLAIVAENCPEPIQMTPSHAMQHERSRPRAPTQYTQCHASTPCQCRGASTCVGHKDNSVTQPRCSCGSHTSAAMLVFAGAPFACCACTIVGGKSQRFCTELNGVHAHTLCASRRSCCLEKFSLSAQRSVVADMSTTLSTQRLMDVNEQDTLFMSIDLKD